MDKTKPLQTLKTFMSKNSSQILVFVEMLIKGPSVFKEMCQRYAQ